MTKIAMIGGSGFDDPDFLTNVKSMKMGTPFGPLSHDLITGKFGETEVTIVLRHGKGHRIRPSAVNYRANIWALKEIGISHIVATTACGSLREEIEPGHLVFPDQFIDRTAGRKSTFYEGDQVAHISMADPFCEQLRQILIDTAVQENIPHHPTGTMVTIEGPRFSTRAESKMFRLWGGDIINMSTVPEAVLCAGSRDLLRVHSHEHGLRRLASFRRTGDLGDDCQRDEQERAERKADIFQELAQDYFLRVRLSQRNKYCVGVMAIRRRHGKIPSSDRRLAVFGNND